MTVTQETNKFRLALRPCGGWSQREGEREKGLLNWGMAQEVGRERRLGTERFDGTQEARWHPGAECLVWESEFSFQIRHSPACDLGQVLSLLWVLISAAGKWEGRNKW